MNLVRLQYLKAPIIRPFWANLQLNRTSLMWQILTVYCFLWSRPEVPQLKNLNWFQREMLDLWDKALKIVNHFFMDIQFWNPCLKYPLMWSVHVIFCFRKMWLIFCHWNKSRKKQKVNGPRTSLVTLKPLKEPRQGSPLEWTDFS